MRVTYFSVQWNVQCFFWFDKLEYAEPDIMINPGTSRRMFNKIWPHQETKEKQENEKVSPDEKQQDSINEEIEQNIATLNRLAVLDLHPSGSGLDTEEDEDGEQTNTKTKPRRANRKMDYALLNTGRQIKKARNYNRKLTPKTWHNWTNISKKCKMTTKNSKKWPTISRQRTIG